MMSTQLKPVLQTHNAHPRDANIVFQEEGHKYTILTDPDSAYTSVTTWNHSHFLKFDPDAIIKTMMSGKNWNSKNKYWNMTPDEIKTLWEENGKSVSSKGTEMHFQIECFMNNDAANQGYTHEDLLNQYTPIEDASLEWTYFLDFVKNNPTLKPYRTEWLIYDDNIKLAGSIDMVYETPDGDLLIYDWKRSKDITKTNPWNKSAITECISHLPDTNFWHYSLQLNTYKTILEKKYAKRVTGLFLVKLHPDNPKNTFEVLKVPFLETEMEELYEYRKSMIT
jgi:ATP-dependent exoDNAse (exonuclease V) beta subunit